MISIQSAIENGASPQVLAQAVLNAYYRGKEISFPVNPFQMLTDYGVPFSFRPMKKCEGFYLPAQSAEDIAVVGINLKRPITRQRFTAAHELCHHVKDGQSSQMCDANLQNPVEQYAESFAAELLMPYDEMDRQIQMHLLCGGKLNFDDVLSIAQYFGVSFLSCLFRSAYVFHAIDGDTDSRKLKKRASSYHADKKRTQFGYTDTRLYEQLIDAGEQCFRFSPNNFVKTKYANHYVYNDSRMEGVDLEQTKVSEIVTDIRLHGKDSPYCSETYQNFVEVAGHAILYEHLFSMQPEDKIDVFTLIRLNQKLFSCAPASEYAGSVRTSNPLVTGAKFETLDCTDVLPAMIQLNPVVQNLLLRPEDVPLSEFVERAAEIHHRLTIIHPFADGNGRTTRAFLNLLLMRRGLLPIYIKVSEKEDYYAALACADQTQKLDALYAVIFKAILRAQAELTESPMLYL